MQQRDHQLPSRQLDVRAFARMQGTAGGTIPVPELPRLASECVGGGESASVSWSVEGRMPGGEGSLSAPWLLVRAETALPLVCQRCLEPVSTPVQVDQQFRFVPDEATAEQQDDAAVEDLLVESTEFDLCALIEDELLLAMPLIAHHAVCPTAPRLSVQDQGFDDATDVRPPPFAALGRLRKGDGESTE